jgi:Domain of unknown function (DUF4440)
MKFLTVLLMLAAAAPLSSQTAPNVSTTLPAAERAELEAIRRDVWIHWFSGDTLALKRVLPPELVAISPDDEHWQSLSETLKGSAAFRASGAVLEEVTFDRTHIQRFGEVVVMFSHYEVRTRRDAERSSQRGRATEVFVRLNGRWVHTSWHLDINFEGPPAA